MEDHSHAFINELNRIHNRVDVGPAPRKDYTPFGTMITDLNRAIIEEKKIRMAYFSMSRWKESRRTVHPYRLRHVEDTLYLIGHCALRKGVRTFAVDRIQSVTLTDERFQTPESFDIKAFLQDSFGIFQGPPVTVKIRFTPSVAGYIRERVWHSSQELTNAEDGALIFTATVAGVEEISHWVMRWGAGAQVEVQAVQNLTARALDGKASHLETGRGVRVGRSVGAGCGSRVGCGRPCSRRRSRGSARGGCGRRAHRVP